MPGVCDLGGQPHWLAVTLWWAFAAGIVMLACGTVMKLRCGPKLAHTGAGSPLVAGDS